MTRRLCSHRIKSSKRLHVLASMSSGSKDLAEITKKGFRPELSAPQQVEDTAPSRCRLEGALSFVESKIAKEWRLVVPTVAPFLACRFVRLVSGKTLKQVQLQQWHVPKHGRL